MKKINLLIVFGLLVVIGLVTFYLNKTDDRRVYSSKQSLCQQFSQSYLKTVQKTDKITDFGSEKWQMAIDIETEMYNLCLTDLNKDALKNYKTSAIEKYQK